MRPIHLRSRHRITWWLGVFCMIFCAVIWWENVHVAVLPTYQQGSTHSISIDALSLEQTNSTNDMMVNAWPVISDSRTWCRQAKKEDSPGLIYVKIPKTGSSTMVGINIRIARKVGERSSLMSPWWSTFFERHHTPTTCSFTFRHGRHEMLERQEPYLLWSFVRDPAARGLSEFYHFEASRLGRRRTDLSVKTWLGRQRNFQFLYLADHPDPQTMLAAVPRASDDSISRALIHQYILQRYHFIGLLERKLESLAVIKLLWGLETHDLVVLSAKKSGGYDDGRFNGSCIRIQLPPKPLSPFLQGYIDDSFQKENIDYLLYEMVNLTLDKTIQSLGVDAVKREVDSLKEFQILAERRCQATAIFPCSPNGTLQLDAASRDCYWSDSGCGHTCVDQVLQEGQAGYI